MSSVARKPGLGVSYQVRHIPVGAAKEDGQRLAITELGRRGIVLSVKRKQRRAADLICTFVFAYAKGRFSHDAAQRDKFNTIIFFPVAKNKVVNMALLMSIL